MVFNTLGFVALACGPQVYHSLFWPLEFTVPGRDNNRCYAKLICNKLDNVSCIWTRPRRIAPVSVAPMTVFLLLPSAPQDRVIGFHYLGPNAGEVTQGFGVAMKCGATKEQLDGTIGIHPTCAEVSQRLSLGGLWLRSGDSLHPRPETVRLEAEDELLLTFLCNLYKQNDQLAA